MQINPEPPSKLHEDKIGRRLDEHDVSGFTQGLHRQIHRLLRTIANQDRLAATFHSLKRLAGMISKLPERFLAQPKSALIASILKDVISRLFDDLCNGLADERGRHVRVVGKSGCD